MKNWLVKHIETFLIYIVLILKKIKWCDCYKFYPWESISHFFYLKIAWIFLSITCLGIFIGWLINIYD
jgi:hypothetical protein